MSRLKAAVAAVAVAEAIKRIHRPIAWDPTQKATFFSHQDVWLYVAIMDTRVCPVCRDHEDKGSFRGDHLRAQFPYLEIQDLMTIKVNAHPNCRCYLTRKLTP